MGSLVATLSDVLALRNTLVQCDTPDDAIRTALEAARNRLRTQTASVFLFSKNGVLERHGLLGVDRGGTLIPASWFPSERHAPGDSFTGRAVIPVHGSPYGEPQWSNNLANDQLDSISHSRYLAALGALKCAIAVPLNGLHRSYGALEVINKVDEDDHLLPGGSFSKADVFWLSIVGMTLASALSALRRRSELTFLARLAALLVAPNYDDEAADIYDLVADELTGVNAAYRGCLIRLLDQQGALTVVTRRGDSIDWASWEDRPSRGDDDAPSQVLKSHDPVIIPVIEDERHRLHNAAWAEANHLRSYACFPLANGGTVLGTMSIYAGYHHHFFPSERRYLENLAALMAAALSLRAARDELDIERSAILRTAQMAAIGAHDVNVEIREHEHKGLLEHVIQSLTEAATATPGRRDEILDRTVQLVKTRLAQSVEAFQLAPPEPVNVNDVARSAVRYFRRELRLRQSRVELREAYENQIPSLLVRESDIKDVMHNLLSNAIRSVEQLRRRDGFVSVTTQVVTSKHQQFIEIIIDDNGGGVRNEDSDRIFERNFTTQPGGSGMGLYLSRQIVEKEYGGRLSFESTLGHGANWGR